MPAARGTGRGVGRARDVPPRGVAGPLAGEQPTEAPGVDRPTESPAEARTAAPPEQIPGQTALKLRHMQPTLWSL